MNERKRIEKLKKQPKIMFVPSEVVLGNPFRKVIEKWFFSASHDYLYKPDEKHKDVSER